MKIVIFAGGVGSRLWPLSRKNTPKQFGRVVGEQSTLQQTIYRLLPEFRAADIYIATGKQYRKTVMEQLPFIPKDNFIFEPMMRDVGPAIGLVSTILEKKFPDEPFAILWSDHLVKDEPEFRRVLRMGEDLVKENDGSLVFIAQKPRFANQNLGWIEMGEKIKADGEAEIYGFKKLIYRPSQEDADVFFKKSNFMWNLGYYITTPKVIVGFFEKFAPDMYKKFQKIQKAHGTSEYNTILEEVYPTLEKISFDDAILMKLGSENLFVIGADMKWSDVGTWDALKEALSSAPEENVITGDVMLDDSEDNLVFNYSKVQLCVGIDLKEMVVINTDDVLLVCPKTAVPKIKKFVEKLGGTPLERLA